MSRPMKYGILQLIAWFIVGVTMICIFTTEGTIDHWGDNSLKTLLIALLFIFGFTTDFILRLLEKTKRFGFKRDERDKYIQSKAMEIGFITVLLYIFLLTITIYAKFESQGMIPVGYMWFVAYSTIVMANLCVGIFSLWYYRKQGF